MAKQPQDLVVRILRDIQQTLADHSKRFDQVDRRFDEIERRLDDLDDGVVAALGLATRANVRHDAVDRRLDELRALIARLGRKR